MRKELLAATVLIGAIFGGSAASATELLFSYAEPGGVEFSFEQASMPTPNNYSLLVSTDVPVTEISSNVGTFDSIDWFSAEFSGMFDADTSPTSYNVFGPQVYGGSEASPSFSTGIFPGAGQTDGASGILTVSEISAAPEPSTWLLMFAGIGGIGLMLRQAKRKMGWRFEDAFSV